MLGLIDVMNIDWGQFGETLLLVALFLLSLDVVVLFHELGHFIMAKRAGIRVEVFSVGMGKRLFGVKIGQTDWRFSLLPIGGYVKMSGQEDFAALDDNDVDPESFANKTVGQRFSVIAAGVIMNVIFGFFVFTVLAMTGIDWFDAPIVGGAVPGYPADTAIIQWEDGQPDSEGLEPGDRVLEINGKHIESFQQLKLKAVLAQETSTYEFTIARTAPDGTERIGRATLGVRYADGGTGTGSQMLSFGIAQAATLTTAAPDGMRVGSDVIDAGKALIAVNGQPVEHEWDLSDIEDTLTGEPVELTFRDADGNEETITHTPTLLMTGSLLTDGRYVPADELFPAFDEEGRPSGYVWKKDDGTEEELKGEQFANALFDVLGLQPRLKVEAVQDGSRADRAGVEPGDIVLSYGGAPLPTLFEFLDINSQFAGQETELVVQRGDMTPDPILITPTVKKGGRAVVGTVMGLDMDHLVIGHIREDSPAATAFEDMPQELDGKRWMVLSDLDTQSEPVSFSSWAGLVNALSEEKRAGATKAGFMAARDRLAPSFELSLEQFEPDAYEYFLFGTGQPFEPLKAETIRYRNPIKALGWGLDQTGQQVVMGYMQFWSLFTGTVSAKELKGPVGIGGIAVKTAKMGPGRFVYFIGFLSIALAIVNFLPLPVVDGGHALFLIIEKIRGKPLSVKVMNVIQFTGLAVLLGLILWLTFNDIIAMIFNAW